MRIGGVDNERVAFPVAAQVALPLADADMRPAVQGNDAGVVDHFGQDPHVVRSLEHLEIVVVGTRVHRRPGIEPDEAALRQRAGLRMNQRANARAGSRAPIRRAAPRASVPRPSKRGSDRRADRRSARCACVPTILLPRSYQNSLYGMTPRAG